MEYTQDEIDRLAPMDRALVALGEGNVHKAKEILSAAIKHINDRVLKRQEVGCE